MNKGKVSNLVTKGQVLWVDLPDVESGSVQKGRRPVVVISNNKGNQFSPVILVAPLTSRKKKHLPTHVDVFANETNGIKSDSTVLCEQLFTITDTPSKCFTKSHYSSTKLSTKSLFSTL